VIENQRGEPGFVLRVNPDAFVSSMATAGKRWPKKILPRTWKHSHAQRFPFILPSVVLHRRMMHPDMNQPKGRRAAFDHVNPSSSSV
jgi:hypothetical protein